METSRSLPKVQLRPPLQAFALPTARAPRLRIYQRPARISPAPPNCRPPSAKHRIFDNLDDVDANPAGYELLRSSNYKGTGNPGGGEGITDPGPGTSADANALEVAYFPERSTNAAGAATANGKEAAGSSSSSEVKLSEVNYFANAVSLPYSNATTAEGLSTSSPGLANVSTVVGDRHGSSRALEDQGVKAGVAEPMGGQGSDPDRTDPGSSWGLGPSPDDDGSHGHYPGLPSSYNATTQVMDPDMDTSGHVSMDGSRKGARTGQGSKSFSSAWVEEGRGAASGYGDKDGSRNGSRTWQVSKSTSSVWGEESGGFAPGVDALDALAYHSHESESDQRGMAGGETSYYDAAGPSRTSTDQQGQMYGAKAAPKGKAASTEQQQVQMYDTNGVPKGGSASTGRGGQDDVGRAGPQDPSFNYGSEWGEVSPSYDWGDELMYNTQPGSTDHWGQWAGADSMRGSQQAQAGPGWAGTQGPTADRAWEGGYGPETGPNRGDQWARWGRQSPGREAAGPGFQGSYPQYQLDVTILSREETDMVLPLAPSGRQAAYYAPRNVAERLVEVLGSVGATVMLSKVTMLAAPALLYPMWNPWIRAGIRNLELFAKQFTCLGLWKAVVLEAPPPAPFPFPNMMTGAARYHQPGAILRLVVGEPYEGGARAVLEFPVQAGELYIQQGDPVELLVLGKDPSFKQLKVVREVYLPRQNVWLADYPFVSRVHFLNVSHQIDLERQA